MAGVERLSATASTDNSNIALLADGIEHPAVTDDGEWVAYADQEEDTILVKNIDSGELVEQIEIDGDEDEKTFGGLAFSPDRTYLSVVVHTDDGRGLYVYETENWERVHEDLVSQWGARGTAFSRDGNVVTWGRGDGEVRVIDTDGWDRVETLSETARSYDNEFSTEYFAHTDFDEVHVYGYDDSEFEKFDEFDGEEEGLSFSADGQYLAHASESTVVVRNTADWDVVETLDEPDNGDEITDVEFVGTGASERLAYAVPDENVVYVHSTDDWSLDEEHTIAGATLPRRPLASDPETGTLVVTWDSPVAASASPDAVVVGEEIEFEVATEVEVDDYVWDFGDGETTTTGDETVTHTYEDAGDHVAEVTAHTTDDREFTDEVIVQVSHPIEAVTVSPDSTVAGDDVEFEVEVVEDVTVEEYSWDFGDGETTTTAEGTVEHTYYEVDNHVAAVTVAVEDVGEYSAEVEVEITSPLDATASPDLQAVGEDVEFEVTLHEDSDLTIDDGDYEWDFTGDDETDETGSTVTHAYDDPGEYVAAVTATPENETYDAEVEVEITEVIAEFTVEPMKPSLGSEVTFDASESGGDITTYEWDFGDGTTETTDDEITHHVFEAGGEYTVTLTVSDGAGNTDTTDRGVSVDRELWAFETDDDVESSPTVVDGTVYVGSTDGSLYALDGATGDEKWRFQTDPDEEVVSSPTVVDGTVYFGSTDGYVYAVDADPEWDEGSAEGDDYEWRFDTGDTGSEAFLHFSPTVSDGLVYIWPTQGIYALDADPDWEDNEGSVEDEDYEWEKEIFNWADSSVAVVDDTLYAGQSTLEETDGYVYALDAASGDEKWFFDAGERAFTSPTVAEERVYVVSVDGVVYALDTDPDADGSNEVEEYEWRFDTENADLDLDEPLLSSPTVADGTVYVGARGELFALDADPGWDEGTASDGDHAWRFTVEEGADDMYSSPTVAGDRVYFGTDDGSVYALETDPDWDGGEGSAAQEEFDWKEVLGGDITSSPTVADGVVYVGTHDNSVYALAAGTDKSSEGSRVDLGTLGHTDTWALQASAGGVFSVAITDVTRPVDPGETLTVTVRLENTDDVAGTTELSLYDTEAELGSAERVVSVDAGAIAEETISLETSENADEGPYTVQVVTADDQDETTVWLGLPEELSVVAEGDVIEEVEGGEREGTLSIDAARFEEITVEKAWLDWEVEVSATEGTEPDTFPAKVEDDSTIPLEWNETDPSEGVSLAVTLSPSEQYVGGEYRLRVTAHNDGASVEDDAILRIL